MVEAKRVILPIALIGILGCEHERIQLLLDGDIPPLPNKGDTIPGATALRIEPTALTVTSDGRPPGETASFRAIARFDDGERDITDDVRWTISELGSIDRGEVVTAESAGGTAVVRATAGGLEASADLTVRLDVLERTPDVPDDVAARFPEDTSDDQNGGVVSIVYPAPDTVFPSNVTRVRHQWRSTLVSPLFEVRFESSIARVRIHTRAPYYQLDELSAGWIPRTHAGRSITMTVRAVEESGGTVVHRSEARAFRYARSEILGDALYWSTTARGIMRASLADPRGLLLLPASGSGCVSCHAVSRDGRRIAAALGDEDLAVFDIAEPPEALSVSSGDDDDPEYAFGTFSPDGNRLLVAEEGRLRLYDLEADSSQSVDLAGARVTHPDWSPDGRWVAVSLRQQIDPLVDKKVSGTSLARIPVDDEGDFGTPEILLASGGDDDTITYPTYSPDGRFIAFARVTGDSKDNPATAIHLIASDGSSTPILLGALNARPGNTMPSWAPSTNPSVQWIAFSAIRDYGDVLVGLGRDQLWASAIDVDRIAAGSDPSSPAFWIPFQDPAEHNHRALWIPSERSSSPDACTPAPEACNGRDDDCDLAVDEGCGCAIVEICGNGRDDDCDDLDDDEDEDC